MALTASHDYSLVYFPLLRQYSLEKTNLKEFPKYISKLPSWLAGPSRQFFMDMAGSNSYSFLPQPHFLGNMEKFLPKEKF